MDEPKSLGSAVKDLQNTLASQEKSLSSFPPEAVKCSLCNDSKWIKTEIFNATIACECVFLDAMHKVESLAGDSIKPDLLNHRLTQAAPKNRCFTRSIHLIDDSKLIMPSEYVASNGLSLRDQEKILDHLGRAPLAGYYFIGRTGVGKSFLLFALAKEAAFSGRKVFIRKTTKWIDAERKIVAGANIEDTAILMNSIDLENDLTSNIYGPAHLYLDEIDNISATDFSIKKMFELLDYCLENSKQVVLSVTSNLSLEKWAETFGAASRRRIESLCSQINMCDGR